MPTKSLSEKSLLQTFAKEVASFREVPLKKVKPVLRNEFDVEGYVALSAETPDFEVHGWVRRDGSNVVIVNHTSPVPLLDALGFGDKKPAINDARLAELLAWGYHRFELLRRVEKGDLGMKRGLVCPPVRKRQRDGSTVLRWVVRVKDDECPSIMELHITRAESGKYKFEGRTLASKRSPASDEDE